MKSKMINWKIILLSIISPIISPLMFLVVIGKIFYDDIKKG